MEHSITRFRFKYKVGQVPIIVKFTSILMTKELTKNDLSLDYL